MASRSSGFRFFAAAFLLLTLYGSPGRAEDTLTTTTGAPILVELFTSQGCSSCPPADRLLSRLAAKQRVIALAFHVDYWNYIGWTDPFSSPEWSERQRRYAAAFGSGRIYTPQLVVNGRWEGVGSDPREVEAMLARAQITTAADLELEITDAEGRLTAHLRTASRRDGLTAWVAVAESGFATPVGRGENAELTLRNDNVVRRLARVALIETPAGLEAEYRIDLHPDWDRENLRLVAFLQDPATMHVLAAAQLTLSG